MELKDLEPYIKANYKIEICGEIFRLGTTDDMEIPEDQIQAVWCSDNYTIYATPRDNFGLMVSVYRFDPEFEDDEDEQEIIGEDGSEYVQMAAFNQYRNYVREIATKIITQDKERIRIESDPAEVVKQLIADGRKLLEEREKLTKRYKKDIERIDWLIKENGKAVSKAMAIRDANKGDDKHDES
jgi:hypothetical protein